MRSSIREGAKAADDCTFLRECYKKWGLDLAQHLIGSFSFLIWDQRNQRLVVCRDHMGTRPLFCYSHKGSVYFASRCQDVLRATGERPRLNLQRLARFSFRQSKNQDKSSHFYQGFESLLPATIRVYEKGRVREWSYWDIAPDKALGFGSDEAFLEAFAETLDDVVGSHLHRDFPNLSLLSGGLDSSLMVVAASRILAQRGQTLHTLSTKFQDFDGVSGLDETDFIEEFRAHENVEIDYLDIPHGGPFDSVEENVQTFESPVIFPYMFVHRAFARHAERLGAPTLLHGIGGEYGVSYFGNEILLEFFCRGQWKVLYKELKARARLEGRQVWRAAASALLGPILKPASSRPTPQQAFLQPEFLRKYACPGSPPATGSIRNLRDHRPGQVQMLKHRRRISHQPGFCGYEGVQPAFPLMDPRLLEFCLWAPSEWKVRDGYPRYLARSLEGVLPEKIRWRTCKQPFCPDYHLRYNRQRESVLEQLCQIRKQDPVREIVNVEFLKRQARLPMTGMNLSRAENMAGLQIVPGGVNFIAFLRQFSEYAS